MTRAFVSVLAMLAASACRREPPEPLVPLTPAGTATVCPAAPSATCEESSTLGVLLFQEMTTSGRRLRLQVGGGTAILTLRPPGMRHLPTYGECTLEAPAREEGRSFVRAVADWLERPDRDGLRPEAPLEATRCHYDILPEERDATGNTWSVRKVVLAQQGSVEILLRTPSDWEFGLQSQPLQRSGLGELVEVNPAQRDDLVEALALVLRDGLTARRTGEMDSGLASDEPLCEPLVDLADAAGHHAFVRAGSRFFTAVPDDGRDVIRVWRSLDGRPRDVVTLEGRVMQIAPDRDGKRLAVVVVKPSKPHNVTFDDPTSVFLVDVASGRKTPVLAEAGDVRFTLESRVAWSPAEDRLALSAFVRESRMKWSGYAVVVDASSGKRREATDPADNLRLFDWNGSGVQLSPRSRRGSAARLPALVVAAGRREAGTRRRTGEPLSRRPILAAPGRRPDPRARAGHARAALRGQRRRDSRLADPGRLIRLPLGRSPPPRPARARALGARPRHAEGSLPLQARPILLAGVESGRARRPRRGARRTAEMVSPPSVVKTSRRISIRATLHSREGSAMASKKQTRKTTRTLSSVSAFLATIESPARREDCQELLRIMHRASGELPAMWGEYIVGFGSYRYTLASGAEEEAPAIAFSPRSTKIALYHMHFESNRSLVKRLGKYGTGKKCMYVTRLSEVDLEVLEELCAASYRSITGRPAKKRRA